MRDEKWSNLFLIVMPQPDAATNMPSRRMNDAEKLINRILKWMGKKTNPILVLQSPPRQIQNQFLEKQRKTLLAFPKGK